MNKKIRLMLEYKPNELIKCCIGLYFCFHQSGTYMRHTSRYKVGIKMYKRLRKRNELSTFQVFGSAVP